jgi:hypothetical protein
MSYLTSNEERISNMETSERAGPMNTESASVLKLLCSEYRRYLSVSNEIIIPLKHSNR